MPMSAFNVFEKIPAETNDVAQINGDLRVFDSKNPQTHHGVVLDGVTRMDDRNIPKETW